MNNKSISDYVAASMDAALKSDEYKSLFGTQYKYAQVKDDNSSDSNCVKDSSKEDSCSVDDCSKDDSCSVDDCSKDDSCSVDDDWLFDDSQSNEENFEENFDKEQQPVFAALDMAIDGLLTTSAALDSIGMSKGSLYALKLASLVVEAKKAKKMKKGKKKVKPGASKSTSSKSTGKPSSKSSSKPTSKSKAKGSSSSSSSSSSKSPVTKKK